MPETNRTSTDRLYLRIDESLKEEMKAYAERNDVCLSRLVRSFFLKLLEKEKKEHEARQF